MRADVFWEMLPHSEISGVHVMGTILFLLIGMMITMMHDTTRYYKIKTQIVKKKKKNQIYPWTLYKDSFC